MVRVSGPLKLKKTSYSHPTGIGMDGAGTEDEGSVGAPWGIGAALEEEEPELE